MKETVARSAPPTSAPAAAPGSPALLALDLIESSLHRAALEKKLAHLVTMDLRAIERLRTQLGKNPIDPDDIKFLRQLAMVWSTRFSGMDYLTFRDVFKIIEKCGVR